MAGMSQLPEKIRQARQAAQLTQGQVAERLGLTRGAVTQWESGNPDTRTTPSLDLLRRLAAVVGVPFEWLLDDKARPEDVHFARARQQAIKRAYDKPNYRLDDVRAAARADDAQADNAGEAPIPRRALAFWRAVEFELCSRRPDLEPAFEVPLSADDLYVVADLHVADLVVTFDVAPLEHSALPWVRRKAGDLLVAEKLVGHPLRKVILVWSAEAINTAALAALAKPLGIELATFATPREAAEHLLSLL